MSASSTDPAPLGPARTLGAGRRRRAAATLLVIVLVSCGGDDTAGPVSLDVPTGWERVEPSDPTDDLVAEERWRPSPADGATLQVIVGCGDADADQLRLAMSEAYHLTSDATATAVEVPGLRSAQRIDWELRADPSGEEGAFRMAGLYGSGSGGLVVVELGAPAAAFDADLAGTVLDSVNVDTDRLVAECDDP